MKVKFFYNLRILIIRQDVNLCIPEQMKLKLPFLKYIEFFKNDTKELLISKFKNCNQFLESIIGIFEYYNHSFHSIMKI